MTQPSEEVLVLYRGVAAPFILDGQGRYDAAIEAYNVAQETLEKLTGKGNSQTSKVDRKVYERQLKIITARRDYLTEMTQKGQLQNLIKIPTRVSLEEQLEDPTLLSSIHKASTGTIEPPPTGQDAFDWSTATTTATPALSSQLPSDLPPVEYAFAYSSELVGWGTTQIWYFIRDPTTQQNLWTLSAIWRKDTPIVTTMFRRCGEVIPNSASIQVKIMKTRGGAFNMAMQSHSTGWTYETPDRAEHKKDLAPRRFRYADRHFVWKADGPAWETLYETSRVGPVEGSRTGKKTEEIVGEKLFWGEKPKAFKGAFKIWFKAGLDQGFVEHCLASQLARMMRASNPARSDASGLETAGKAATGLSVILSLAAF